MKKLFLILSAICCLFCFSCAAAATSFDADEIYQSVFVIESGNSLGSGFAVDEHLIVTNAHVIDDRRNVVVSTYDGRLYTASLEEYDSWQDVALLYVGDAVLTPLTIGDVSLVKTGDDVYAIGAPKNMPYTLTKGIVSNRDRSISGMTYLQIDAAVNEGNSGGPLLNAAGEVIGVNTLKMMDTEGIALSIPIDVIVAFIADVTPEDTTAATETEAQPATTEENEEEDTSPAVVPEREGGTFSGGAFYAVCALAAVSVLLNIVFIILLVGKKQKDILPPPDPRERTDFEIDILE